jgi:hypothetical protein
LRVGLLIARRHSPKLIVSGVVSCAGAAVCNLRFSAL